MTAVKTLRPLPATRSRATILHADLDAFYASVEQIDKPSLRGKPVVVSGLGLRGVVATASYEARIHGVRSAMSTMEARGRCPKAAFLAPRFGAYRAASVIVMGQLHALSPLIEPLSLDEAYVDLEAGGAGERDLSVAGVRQLAERLKASVFAATGLTLSVGIGTSKLVAKIASDLDKPDGLVVVESGNEDAVLRPLPVGRLPGVGPATAAKLRAIGVATVADLADLPEAEAVRALGNSQGRGLWLLAHGLDDREVTPERESKSVSVEDTFEHDIADVARLTAVVDEMARRVVERLRGAQLSGRTISIKVRLHDFTTLTRSATLPAPTDDARVVVRLARQLLTEVDVSGGLRLVGVGVSGLADWTQDDLFGELIAADPHDDPDAGDGVSAAVAPSDHADRAWVAGRDVMHPTWGHGWVQGSGAGWVTVRFETRHTPPGRVRSFRIADPDLQAAPPIGW
jgi:DNA polymerase-4